MRVPLIPLLPNRVRRNYLGGYLLDQFENNPSPHDGNRPEDWLASTVEAVNPGLETIANEGLAYFRTPRGEKIRLQDLFKKEPEYYFGASHVELFGAQPGFLAKLLDSSMRLHVQAHPSANFACKHLNSPWGKLEVYIILGLRHKDNSYIRLGFQRPPSPQEWKRIILDQDITAMDACFDPIPVNVGEVWLIPGGLPHAIGEGIMMLEVMEPSDLVVRCEFEREGVVVPPEARFMQSSVDQALQIFDYTPLTVEQVINNYRIVQKKIRDGEELLIGPSQTDLFSVTRMTISDRTSLPSPGCLRLGVVVHGRGTLTVDNQNIALKPGVRFLVAASAPEGDMTAAESEALQILFCSPGRALIKS
jgi:mannose-6-phosphate isomerase